MIFEKDFFAQHIFHFKTCSRIKGSGKGKSFLTDFDRFYPKLNWGANFLSLLQPCQLYRGLFLFQEILLAVIFPNIHLKPFLVLCWKHPRSSRGCWLKKRSGNQGEKIWDLRNEGETTDMGLWELDCCAHQPSPNSNWCSLSQLLPKVSSWEQLPRGAEMQWFFT